MFRWFGIAFLLLTLMSASQAADPLLAGNADFDLRVQRWSNTLDSIAEDLSREGITRSQIAPLSDNLGIVQSSVLAAQERAAAAADEQRRLLDSLGPKPGDDEPAESDRLDTIRADIEERFRHVDEQRRRSELMLARIDLLFARMSEAEYRALTTVLAEQVAAPLSPATMAKGMSQLEQRLEGGGLEAKIRWPFAADVTDPDVLLRAGLVGAAIVTLLTLRRRLLARHGYRPVADAPGLGRRVLATFAETLGNVLLPALALTALWMAIRSLHPSDESPNGLVDELAIAILIAIVVIGLAAAVLAPTRPQWRISRFSDSAALSLFRAVRLYALLRLAVVVLLVLLNPPRQSIVGLSEESISAFFASEPQFYAILGLLALLVTVGALLNVLRPGNWRFQAGPDESADAADRPPKRWLRITLALSRGVLVVALLLSFAGYLFAGIYLADRVSFTLGLIAAAYVLRVLAAAGMRSLTSSERKIGRKLRRHMMFSDDGAARLTFWLLLILDVVLASAVLVLLALRWGVPNAEFWRFAGMLAYGFKIGSFTLSLVDIVTTAVVFLLLLTFVRLLQGFLAQRILPQTRLDVGARDALSTVFGYVGLTVAALVVIAMLGLDLSQLALILGALSVGIGFGLQHVISNFVAGLILLIQRPIKSGDWIVVGNGAYQGYVKHVSVTSTEIETFDNASVLVPNSNLLSNEVLNWTHKSTLGRVILAVRTAYGSDPEKVRNTLLACADAHPMVLSRPEPVALLQNFGPSSLDFELRFYLREIDTLLEVGSELRIAVLSALDEAGIAIPFPQQDVHIHQAAPWPEPDAEPSSRHLTTGPGKLT